MRRSARTATPSSPTAEPADIRAFFAAAEASYDVDWARFRLSGLYASGDSKPYDNTETGFDAIFENPIFAGADTSYWIRQSIPFAGGGRVINVSQRNGLLNDLRSSKEEGQSNFNNPGTMLLASARISTSRRPCACLGQRQPSVVRADRGAAGAARRGERSPRSIGWDYSPRRSGARR